MYQLPHSEEGDSDNDEGFVVNTIEIKQKDRPKIVISSNQRPTDYQPRYINTNMLIRKEMPDLIRAYPHFPNQQQQINQKSSPKKDKEIVPKIDQPNFPNKNYQLVYQSNHKKNQLQSISTEYNIDLSSIVNYSADNYSILKNWDIKPNNDELIFQSRFQCGNLLYAYKSLADPHHYLLFLQNDTNTNGYNKWFYFAVRNKKSRANYTFSIVNLRKNLAFFKQGMKPTRFSVKQQEAKGNGWSKNINKVSIYRSRIGQETQQFSINQHYTLTFEVNFDYENDTNFFSLLPPYSYSKLTNFLISSKENLSQKSEIKLNIQTIAYSLSNTQVPYVTIGNTQQSKKNILILARQHPGQVWSSFFVESLIRELLRDSFPQKDWLLKNYTFKIFPMINVDGVIYGNFRCDLSGTDLNRVWKEPNKLLHPHIVAIKEQIRRLSAEEQVVSCLDLHAHSKEFNIFAYCCKTDNHGRALPLLISKMSNLFYFPYCTYGISRYKETTARAVINQITKAPDVLTIESSFFAASNPFKALTPSVYISFSNSVIKALKHYYSKDTQYKEAEEYLPKAMAQVAALRINNRQKYALKEQSGSDSEPDIDEIDITQKLGQIIPKCSIVLQAFGLKDEQKVQQSLAKAKRLSQQLKSKKSQKKENKSISIARNTISQQPIIHQRVEKPPLIIQRPRAISNKTTTNFLERLTRRKEKDTSEQRQKARQKKQIEKNYKYTIKQQQRNQSLELNKNKTINKFLASEFRSTFKERQLKFEMEQIVDKKEEEFPLLCILSDSKKQAHLQKLRRIHPAPSVTQRQKNIVRYQPTLVVSKKLDTMQRLRERQKKSNDLVSSLWKDTLGYNEQRPITHIFYAIP